MERLSLDIGVVEELVSSLEREVVSDIQWLECGIRVLQVSNTCARSLLPEGGGFSSCSVSSISCVGNKD